MENGGACVAGRLIVARVTGSDDRRSPTSHAEATATAPIASAAIAMVPERIRDRWLSGSGAGGRTTDAGPGTPRGPPEGTSTVTGAMNRYPRRWTVWM